MQNGKEKLRNDGIIWMLIDEFLKIEVKIK
jgi:hypothetical protein